MHITNTSPAHWPRTHKLPADISRAILTFPRSAQLTTRELRNLVAEMVD